jgi:hypothetical protein
MYSTAGSVFFRFSLPFALAMILVILGYLLGVAGSLPSSEFGVDRWRKIVVISDIHGDELGFLKSVWIALRKVNETEVISFGDFLTRMDSDKVVAPLYIEQDVLMVQMGDLIDRGPQGRASIEALGKIESHVGWTVRVLYGNHDLFALLGAPYWNMIHPEDDIDHEQELSRPSELSRWYYENALMAVRVADTAVFVHGGLDPKWLATHSYTTDSFENLNRQLHAHLRSNFHKTAVSLGSDFSPVMTRAVARAHDVESVCAELTAFLTTELRVQYMIVGHTPQIGRRVRSMCGGRLVFTDVMISRWMTNLEREQRDLEGGQPSAVILTGTALEAFYTDGIRSETIFSVPITETSPSEIAGMLPMTVEEDLHEEAVEDKENRVPSQRSATSSDLGSILGKRASASETPVVLQDAHVRISEVTKRKLEIEFTDPDQRYVIECMLSEISLDHDAIPRWTVDRKIFMDMVEASIGDQDEAIYSVTRFLHSQGMLVGFVPVETDSDNARETPRNWIRSFFVENTLVNWSRIRRCQDVDQQQAELEYITDHLELTYGEADSSDDQDIEEAAIGQTAGYFVRYRSTEAVNKLIASPRLGIPRSIEIISNTRLFVASDDRTRLSELDCDVNLALQIIGITQDLHADDLCLGFDSEELHALLSLFTVNDAQNVVSLIDLSRLSICDTDGTDMQDELNKIVSLLNPFLEDDDDDDNSIDSSHSL